MAKLIARRDPAARYVYISSADDYPVPPDARDLIKRNGGDFSGKTFEWRVALDFGARVVASLRASGHDVEAIEAGVRPRPKARQVGPPECQCCARPYPTSTTASTCVECGAAPLVLVSPPGADA